MATRSTRLHTNYQTTSSGYICPQCTSRLQQTTPFARKHGSTRPISIYSSLRTQSATSQLSLASQSPSGLAAKRPFDQYRIAEARASPTARENGCSQQKPVTRLAKRTRHQSSLRTYDLAHNLPSNVARYLHTERAVTAGLAAVETSVQPPGEIFVGRQLYKAHNIRNQLRAWQAQYGQDAQDEPNDSGLGHGCGPMGSSFATPALAVGSKFAEDTHEDHVDDTSEHVHSDPSTEDVQRATRFPEPGDLVEIRNTSGGSPLLGVVVTTHTSSAQILTSDGRWHETTSRPLHFQVPNWTSVESLRPLKAYVPPSRFDATHLKMRGKEAQEGRVAIDTAAPRNLSAALVRRLNNVSDAAKKIYRENAVVLDNAYELLATETDLRFGTLSSIAASLLDIQRDAITPEILLAVFRVICQQEIRFASEAETVRVSGYIQIRPKEEVRWTERVADWIRAWQQTAMARLGSNTEPQRPSRAYQSAALIESFLEKSRKIVLRSRLSRTPSLGALGTSSIIPGSTQNLIEVTQEEQFTSAEQKILQFLNSWSSTKLWTYAPTLSSLPPVLLEATGLYDKLGERGNDESLSCLFLQELGVMMPYHSRTKEHAHLLLPASDHSKPLQRLGKVITDMEHKHNFVDSAADLRHDWGSMPVYCIDSSSTVDIDDGISIEPGPHQDGDYWIHVHVSAAAAFLTKDSPLIAMARHVAESWYHPDGHVALLPSWAKQRYWSLAPNRPCLTISALVDNAGNITDTKIQNGIVRNIVHLTPEMVQNASHTKGDPQTFEIMVGETPPESTRPGQSRLAEIDQDIAADLVLLNRIARRRHALRTAIAGEQSSSRSEPEIAVWLQRDLVSAVPEAIQYEAARTVHGDPIIKGTFQPDFEQFPVQQTATPNLVQEAMLLAGEAASRWASGRGIPLLSRGSATSNAEPYEDNKKMAQVAYDAARAEYGGVPRHIINDGKARFPPIIYSVRPLPHKELGLETYCKVTSPMRRYIDIVNHWQILAGLRYEAKSGHSLLDLKTAFNRKDLPYNETALQVLGNYITPRERLAKGFMSAMRKHWLFMLLFRAHAAGDASLPRTLTVTYLTISSEDELLQEFKVFVSDLGVTVGATRSASDTAKVQYGDIWQVALQGVNVFGMKLEIKFERLIRRFADV